MCVFLPSFFAGLPRVFSDLFNGSWLVSCFSQYIWLAPKLRCSILLLTCIGSWLSSEHRRDILSESHVQYNIHFTLTPTNARNCFPSSRRANISELMPEQSTQVEKRTCGCMPMYRKRPCRSKTRTKCVAHGGMEQDTTQSDRGSARSGSHSDPPSYCTGAHRL